MHRDHWIIATGLVAEHGADAFRVVEARLDEMRRARADEDDFREWCWIARAILEITRVTPARAEAVH